MVNIIGAYLVLKHVNVGLYSVFTQSQIQLGKDSKTADLGLFWPGKPYNKGRHGTDPWRTKS